jgi:hypothetical protein
MMPADMTAGFELGVRLALIVVLTSARRHKQLAA